MSDKTKQQYIDRDLAVRKGQAINLAVTSAASQGRINDNKFIAVEFLRFFHLAKMFQDYSVDQIALAIENPEIIEAITKLEESMKHV